MPVGLAGSSDRGCRARGGRQRADRGRLRDLPQARRRQHLSPASTRRPVPRSPRPPSRGFERDTGRDSNGGGVRVRGSGVRRDDARRRGDRRAAAGHALLPRARTPGSTIPGPTGDQPGGDQPGDDQYLDAVSRLTVKVTDAGRCTPAATLAADPGYICRVLIESRSRTTEGARPQPLPDERSSLLAGVRTRVLVSFLALLVISTAASVFVLREVLMSRIGDQVERSSPRGRRAARRSPSRAAGSGRPFAGLDQLFDELSRSAPRLRPTAPWSPSSTASPSAPRSRIRRRRPRRGAFGSVGGRPGADQRRARDRRGPDAATSRSRSRPATRTGSWSSPR